jgi:predicted metal-dependent peptidase
MTLILADAKVQEVVPFEGLESFLLRATMKGGGGTDHRPVFEWLAENRLRPDLFIGLTDLFTRLPTVRPHFPVLWVTPSKHGTAPWGTLVHLD